MHHYLILTRLWRDGDSAPYLTRDHETDDVDAAHRYFDDQVKTCVENGNLCEVMLYEAGHALLVHHSFDGIDGLVVQSCLLDDIECELPGRLYATIELDTDTDGHVALDYIHPDTQEVTRVFVGYVEYDSATDARDAVKTFVECYDQFDLEAYIDQINI